MLKPGGSMTFFEYLWSAFQENWFPAATNAAA